MTDIQQDYCPLCNLLSDFEYGDAKNLQRYYCDFPHNLIISDIAKQKLLKNNSEREKLSELSKMLDEDQLLYIRWINQEIKRSIESMHIWQDILNGKLD